MKSGNAGPSIPIAELSAPQQENACIPVGGNRLTCAIDADRVGNDGIPPAVGQLKTERSETTAQHIRVGGC